MKLKPEKMCKYSSCDSVYLADERLVGENPFCKGEVIYGCPGCRDIGADELLCAVEGCNKIVTCGRPTKEYGYLLLCGNHYQELTNK